VLGHGHCRRQWLGAVETQMSLAQYCGHGVALGADSHRRTVRRNPPPRHLVAFLRGWAVEVRGGPAGGQ
jgi:hypothetical protein